MTQPSHGTLTSSGYQTWIYTATGGYTGTDTFTVSVSSSYGTGGGQGNFGGGGGNETITLNVVPAPPTASNASGSTSYNTATTINLTSRISSQTTPTVNLVSGPSHGTASASGEVVTYTPASNFYGGTDTITYTASNSGGTSSNATITITVGAPPAPSTAGVNASTAYNTPDAINLSSAITGADVTAVTVTGGPSHGTTSVSGETITYTPSPTFYGGVDSFTYTATNPGGTSNTSTVTVTVAPPAAPTASNAASSTSYNTAKAIDLTDSITGADITAVTIASAPGHGTASTSGEVVTYTPSSTFYGGTDSFTYRATNPGGTSSPATVTVTVGAPAAPTTANVVTSTSYNTAKSVDLSSSITGVDVTAVTIASAPGHGTATVSGNVVTYTPSSTFYGGTDSFTYTATNPGGTSSASTVTVAVGTPAAPTTAAVSTSTTYNTPTTVDLSGSIVGTDVTAVTLASAPTHGTATVSGKTVTYTPSSTFYGGTDSFTYTATNPGGTSNASTVTVTVGAPAPPTTAAVSASTAYNTATTVDLSGSIVGTDVTAVTLASAPTHGTAAVSGKTVTYTPSSTFYGGTDTFTYTATNPGGTSGASTITINVGPPATPTTAAKAVNTAYNTAAAIDLTASITGTDVTAVTITTAPTHGTATVNGKTVNYTPSSTFYGGTDSFTYTATNPGGTSAPATVSLTVAVPSAPTAGNKTSGTPFNTATTINLSDAVTGVDVTAFAIAAAPAHGTATVSGTSVTYTPAATFNGVDTFTYTATNPGGTSAPGTVTISVAAPGAPSAAAVDVSTGYNTVATVDLTRSVSGANIIAVTLASAPAHGTASISGKSLTYTPSAAFYGGTDTFTYTATNPGGTSAPATITVTIATPGAPTAAAASASTAYNTATTVNLGDSVTGVNVTGFTIATGPAHGTATLNGRVVTYTPAASFSGGPDTFTYTATNAGGTSAPATVTVTVGGPGVPVAAAKSVSTTYNSTTAIELSGSITGANITAVAVASAPTNGTTAVSGETVTYTPKPGFSGTDSFTYTATNAGGTSAPAKVTVAVGAPGVPIAAAKSVSTAYNSPTAIELSGSITGANITAVAVASAPTNGTTAVSGETVTYTPKRGFSGADSFTYTATNAGGTSAPAKVTVTVEAPGVPAVAGRSVSTGFNTAATIDLSSAITGANITAVAIASAPAHGAANVSGETVTYTPTSGFSGTDSFTYTASNAGGKSAPATVSITVGLPTAPTVIAGTASTAYDTAVAIDLSSAIKGTNITAVTVATAPSHGAATVSGKTIIYTPAASFYGGTDSFTYAASNAGGTSSPATITVTVGKPAFIFSPVSGALQAGTVGKTYSQQIAASGGTAPYVYAVTRGALPPGLALAPKAGAISGTPTSAGNASFTVLAKDANGATSTAAYTLAVTAPTVVAPSISVSEAAAGSMTIDLTANASGGPFTGARLISLSPPNAGTAIITLGDTASSSNEIVAQLVQSGHYKLKFTASPTFSGTAVATFTLSNATSTSAPATVTIVVAPRSDPSKDAEVIGLVNAQVEAAKRFAETQIFNFNDRLEALHDPNCSTNDWGLGVHDSRGLTDHAHTDSLPDHDLDPLTHTAAGGGLGGRDSGGKSGGRDRCSALANGSLAFWTGGFVNFGTNMLNGGNGYDYTTTGMSAGVDYRINPFLAVGAGFGYGSDDSRIGNNGTRSDGEVYDAVGYASYHPGRSIFIDALVGYGRLSFDSERFVTDTGGFAFGKRNGDQVFGSITGGYEYRRNAFFASPYLRLTASHSALDAFTESGAGFEDLRYGSQSVDAITSFLGLRVNYNFLTDWGAIVPELRLEYGHDFAGNNSVALSYADMNGAQIYNLQTLGLGSDFMTLGLRTMVSIGDDKSLDFEYRTSFFQQRTMPQQLRLGLGKKF